MTRALAITYSVAREHHIRITLAFLAGCALLVMLYALYVYQVISHTVALQKAEMSMTALSTKVDSLDAKYLELSSKLTPDALASYGMTPGQVSQYISKSNSLSRVAFGGHEL
jgi:hypothetical protein